MTTPHTDGRPLRFRKKRVTKMSGDIYRLIATIINQIEDPAFKKTVADHFATAFNKRSTRFDPMWWNRATGGTPAPNSARNG